MGRFSNAEAKRALTESRGFLSVAARSLGCSRQALYARLAKSAELRAARADAQELTKDVAELKLLEAIANREAWAVCFYLKCQAKDRGYVERIDSKSEVAVTGTLDINMTDARENLRRKLSGVAERLGPLPVAMPESGNGNGGPPR